MVSMACESRANFSCVCMSVPLRVCRFLWRYYLSCLVYRKLTQRAYVRMFVVSLYVVSMIFDDRPLTLLVRHRRMPINICRCRKKLHATCFPLYAKNKLKPCFFYFSWYFLGKVEFCLKCLILGAFYDLFPFVLGQNALFFAYSWLFPGYFKICEFCAYRLFVQIAFFPNYL